MYTPSAPASPGASPRGRSVTTGKSLRNGTSPSSTAADTAFASGRLAMAQPFCTAHASTEKRPLMSVAVVMTACAPSEAASALASSFAPPIWPESTGITYCPSSSSTSTAGSVALLLRCGATSRTASPTLETKIMACTASKIGP